MAYILAYDIGTTGVKTCIFSLEDSIRLLADASAGYGLYIGENGEGERIVCKLRGWCQYKPGDVANISVKKKHFFDKETEKNLEW